jgi:hypothetical protein
VHENGKLCVSRTFGVGRRARALPIPCQETRACQEGIAVQRAPYPNHWRCVLPWMDRTGAEFEATLWDGRPRTRARAGPSVRRLPLPRDRPSLTHASSRRPAVKIRGRAATCETVGGRMVRSTAVGVECY